MLSRGKLARLVKNSFFPLVSVSVLVFSLTLTRKLVSTPPDLVALANSGLSNIALPPSGTNISLVSGRISSGTSTSLLSPDDNNLTLTSASRPSLGNFLIGENQLASLKITGHSDLDKNQIASLQISVTGHSDPNINLGVYLYNYRSGEFDQIINWAFSSLNQTYIFTQSQNLADYVSPGSQLEILLRGNSRHPFTLNLDSVTWETAPTTQR